MATTPPSPARQRLFQRLEAHIQELEFGDEAFAAIQVVRNIFQCQYAAMDARTEIARDHGLTPGALFSLLLLRACYPDEPVTPTALREAAMLTSGGMAKVLHHLEDQDLVTRRAHPTDARSATLVLTEAGVELIDSITPLIAEKDREMFTSVLTDAEVAELTRLLGKVRTGFRRR
jgi:DNA-binding MarR family transcriptional regulator